MARGVDLVDGVEGVVLRGVGAWKGVVGLLLV
jgi:hypothetical protein